MNGLYGAVMDNSGDGSSHRQMALASSASRERRACVPPLQRQAAFSAADYSSDSDSDDARPQAVYNVDLVVKGQGHSGFEVKKQDSGNEDDYAPLWGSPGQNKSVNHKQVGHGIEDRKQSEKEDDYMPLWAVGKKVSTSIQYKNEDTYAPIWTSNMPKAKQEVPNSKPDMTPSKTFDHGQDHYNDPERSPTVPKTMSLDVSANKTTQVIQREILRHPNNKYKNLGQGQTEEDAYADYDNNIRNYNGRLSKLRLVRGASDLPQVHNNANKVSAVARSHEGQRSREEVDVVGERDVEVRVPSLLERRGILLKEASSEDRLSLPPPLPAKCARNLRSYDQLGRSLERSKSRSKSTRLLSGIAGNNLGQGQSTEAPSSGKQETRDPDEQPIGTLQKIKRHLSRSKSFK